MALGNYINITPCTGCAFCEHPPVPISISDYSELFQQNLPNNLIALLEHLIALLGVINRECQCIS